MIDTNIDLAENDKLIEISKPLFYGFTVLAAFTLSISPAYAGTLLGVAVMASICFVSVGLSNTVDEDWQRVLRIIAVVSLLGALLAGAYISATLSMV
ncbi:MAG: hypothetical protein BRC29_03735 [Nanohaloarchaea archaeon SW_7_43_1]|nr:MAG: hypothetical protein BRC29_03735 [Nanohaloarchaea archaeon SW_7_43_1]